MTPFEKNALMGHLARLGATDVAHTPRFVMKHRTPEELRSIQHGVEGAFKKVEEPLKKGVGKLLAHVPGKKVRGVLQSGANMLIENPETLPLQAVPIPGITPGWLLAKKGLEKGIDHAFPLSKAAAGAPTRGGFMMASDVPAWSQPRLDQVLQKNSGEESIPVGRLKKMQASTAEDPEPLRSDKYASFGGRWGRRAAGSASIGLLHSPEEEPAKAPEKSKEKDSDFSNATWSPGDFRPANLNAKHAMLEMPTEKLAEFVEFLKEGVAGMTPAGHLARTSRVGAPRATPPPGPSIADIAKPSGAKFKAFSSPMGFGSGAAGAHKNTTSGSAPVGLK